MSQTDIYLARGAARSDLIKLACQLSEKIMSAQQSALIICSSNEQLEMLDETLWSFKDTAFIPHKRGTEPEHDFPIVLATESELIAAAESLPASSIDALVYFEPRLLASEPDHQRRFVLVANEEHQISAARSLFKQIKSSNGAIHTHDLR